MIRLVTLAAASFVAKAHLEWMSRLPSQAMR